MINDKLFLIVMLMLLFTFGCASKPPVKSPAVSPPEEKPIFSLPQKKPVPVVTTREPLVEPPDTVLQGKGDLASGQEKPAEKEGEPETPAIAEPEKREESPSPKPSPPWGRGQGEGAKPQVIEKLHLEAESIGILDFHEEKLCNVLKVVSALLGVNVVAKENISELPVTIFLKDVTPRTALEALCRQYGLWYEQGDGYIRLVKVEDFGRVVMSSDGKIRLLMFKGLPLARALAIFSEQTGKNVVCRKNISGDPVNFLITDVSVMTAIEIICKKYNLWYKEDNDKNYICLMKAEDYGKDMGVNYQVRTRVFNLKYASAPQLADSIGCVMGNRVQYALPMNLESYRHLKLPEVGKEHEKIEQAKTEESITEQVPMPKFQDQLTSEKIEELIGKKLDLMLTAQDIRWINKEVGFALMTIFLRNNAIIACSTDDGILKEIGDLIEKLDTPTPQVLIETKILSVNLTDDFTSFFDLKNLVYTPDSRQSFTMSAPVTGVTAFSSVFYKFIDDRWTLDTMLGLLKDDGIINIIATPMLVTAQNSEATTFVGTDDWPLVTNIDTETITDDEGNITQLILNPVVTKTNVGTTLRFTPQINEDRTVTLRLHIKQSAISDEQPTIPYYKPATTEGGAVTGGLKEFSVNVVDTQEIDTIITVPANQTLALGGLVKEQDSVIESKTPFLGDLPLIGFFFKKHQTQKRRTETIFLLTPHIMMAPEEAGDVSKKALEGMEHPYIKDNQKKLFELDEENKRLRRVK